MKFEPTVSVLLVDDDEQLSASIERSWDIEHNIEVHSVTNKEDGISAIRQENFDAIVLDIKCKETKNSIADESVGFPMLKEVVEFLDKNNKDTPVYVHTGYIDKKDEWQRNGLLNILSRDIEVFEKGDDLALITKMHSDISNSESNYLLNKYKKEYNILKDCISIDVAEKLLDIPKLIDQKEKYENILVKFRKIMDPILRKIGSSYTDGQVEWEKLDQFKQLQWLHEESKKDDILYSAALNSQLHLIRLAVNELGVHTSPKQNLYQPTENTLNALFLSLLDIINWFDMFQEQNQTPNTPL